MRFPLLFLFSLSLAAQPVDLGSRLWLFVDRALIGSLHNTTLRLNTPQDRGTVLRFDKPWEGPASAYCTVIKDGPTYRLYYRGQATDQPPSKDPDDLSGAVTCYAESPDGIHWTKPNLRLFTVNGTLDNNVIIREPEPNYVSHNFGAFLDTRPGVPPSERYKGLGGVLMRGDESAPGVFAYASPDGIHWRRLFPEAVINRTLHHFVRTDTSQMPAFWSESEQRYVAYIRLREKHPSVHRDKRARMIGRTTSPDFRHWSPIEVMDYGDAPFDQLYINQTHPYFREPSLYIALAARFVINRKVITDEQARQIAIAPDRTEEVSETVLLTTRGGHTYDRTYMEGFIRPGIGPGHWTTRTNYSALHVVPTGPDEMSIYTQHYYLQPNHQLHRYTLPFDRFASVNAPYAGGEMITRPLRFTGRRLTLNYATSAAGIIQVEVQDEAGRPIPGFTLADAQPIIGNEIERTVSWKSGSDLARLRGRVIRLRFVMKDADLWALRFRKE